MASPLAPTYLDLETELQAARTELKEVKAAAASEIQQINDAAAADKTAHTQNLVAAYSKEILRMCEAAQRNGEELMAENRALREKVGELEGAATPPESATTVKKEDGSDDVAPGSATTVEKEEESDDVAPDDLLASRVEVAYLLSGRGGWARMGLKGGGRATSGEE
ncbi:hypothetical protein LTS10_000123 [Elasticomyces elasticus]|nr:hypothetical protein LTS10_000123 [Elasticomyces elasticus]